MTGLSLALETLKQITAGDSRIVDIGMVGLDTGAQLITNEAAILELISELGKKGTSNHREKSFQIDKTKLSAFLRDEKILLENLLQTGKDYLLGSKKSEKLLIDLLKKADYLYLHFPDIPPIPYTDTGFIKRTLVSAVRYLGTIQAACNIL